VTRDDADDAKRTDVHVFVRRASDGITRRTTRETRGKSGADDEDDDDDEASFSLRRCFCVDGTSSDDT